MTDKKGKRGQSPPPGWSFARFTSAGEPLYEPSQSNHSRSCPAEVQLATATEENKETVRSVRQAPRRSQRARRSTRREDFVYYQKARRGRREEELTVEPTSRDPQEHRKGGSIEGEMEVSTEPQGHEEASTSRPRSPPRKPEVKTARGSALSDDEVPPDIRHALSIWRVFKDDTYEDFDEKKEENEADKEEDRKSSDESPKGSSNRGEKRNPPFSSQVEPCAKKAKID